jgi:hypothetical protein
VNVRMRVVVDVLPEDRPDVRFNDHGEVGALVTPARVDDAEIALVQLAFDDHRSLRLWAAALVDAVDRRYGPPPSPPKRADDAEPEPVGACTAIYGRGE